MFCVSAEGEVAFEVLHVLSFDSNRKRMSVIVKHPMSKEIILYTKGADSAVLSILAKKYKGEYIMGMFNRVYPWVYGRSHYLLLFKSLRNLSKSALFMVI